MTKKEAVELHRKIWNAVSDLTEKYGIAISNVNIRYLDCSNEFKEMLNSNPCCEYDDQFSSECTTPCSNCPIDWQRKKELLVCEKSLYGQWIKAVERGDFKKAASLARHIANLPKR